MWRLTLTDATMPRDQRGDTIGVCGIIHYMLTAVSMYIISDISDVLYTPYQAKADDCAKAHFSPRENQLAISKRSGYLCKQRNEYFTCLKHVCDI